MKLENHLHTSKRCSSLEKMLTSLLLLCFFTQTTTAQRVDSALTAKSDSLFALGVEKYISKEYFEAIPLFEECGRIDSILYKENSSRLGYASIWLASSYYKMGDTNTARSLSDYYMLQPIDRRLTVRSDSISDIVNHILYENGDGYSAIPLIEKILVFEKAELGEENIWVANTNSTYGYALFLTGRIEEALSKYKASLSAIDSLCGKNSKPYLYVLSDIINVYFSTGDSETAYTLALQLLNISKEIKLDDPGVTYTGLSVCGDYLVNQGKFNEAIPYLSQSLEILTNQELESTVDYAVILAELGCAKLYTHNTANAKKLLEKSYSLLLNTSDYYDEYYLIQCMNHLSQANFVEKDTSAAITICKEAISFMDAGIGDKNFLYPDLYYNLWNYYEALSNPNQAHHYAELALKNYRCLDCKNLNYTNLLLNYSDCVSSEGNNQYAIDLIKESLDFLSSANDTPDSVLFIHRCKLAEHFLNNMNLDSAYFYAEDIGDNFALQFHPKSMNCVNIYIKLAPILWYNGKSEKSIYFYKEALKIIEETQPDTDIHYAILSNLAQQCQLAGLYTEAVDYQKNAIKIAKTIYGENSDIYIWATTNLMQYIGTIGDPLEKEEAMLINEQDFLDDTTFKPHEIRRRAMTAAQRGDFLQAESLIENACQTLITTGKEEQFAYLMFLLYRAEIKNYLGKYDEALASIKSYYNVAVEILGEELCDRLSNSYWYTLGKIYVNMNMWDEAEYAFEKGIYSTRLLYGENHIETLLGQVALVAIDMQRENNSLAAKRISLLSNKIRDLIFTNFAAMSSSERMAFWSQLSFIFNTAIPILSYKSNDSQFAGDGYNALLLSKGLLLNTEQEVAQILMESNDKKAIELYNKIMSAHQILNKSQSLRTSNSITEADSLREIIKKSERELIALSSVYGDYTRNLRITWEEIKEQLEEDDVAIEFADVHDIDGTNIYLAFVLKKEMTEPQIVHLFNYADFDKIDSKIYYTSDSLYKIVWEPLEPYFSEYSKIYFSPQGVLHSTAIESTPTKNGVPISELYDMHRLSSTRELCVQHNKTSKKDAVIYGGIDYDLMHTTHITDNKHTGSSVTESFREVIRDELPYLYGTAIEIDSIAAAFSLQKCNTKILREEMASEASLKSLSGTKHTVLHIATHGYYLKDYDTGRTLFTKLLNYTNINQEYTELTHSGLFFSGVNNTISSEEPTDSYNDGILTASEVARLDLHTFDLVTLSACQTGLGKISGEGVFGLQRGFKKAGVKSMLMSLWKVDDDATCLLMTEFYKNWINGETKHRALKLAKQAVRSQRDRGWDAPLYWAGFILLDSLD